MLSRVTQIQSRSDHGHHTKIAENVEKNLESCKKEVREKLRSFSKKMPQQTFERLRREVEVRTEEEQKNNNSKLKKLEKMRKKSRRKEDSRMSTSPVSTPSTDW